MERIAYIVLITVVVLFGVFKDHEGASILMKSLKDAFTILITLTP